MEKSSSQKETQLNVSHYVNLMAYEAHGILLKTLFSKRSDGEFDKGMPKFRWKIPLDNKILKSSFY